LGGPSTNPWQNKRVLITGICGTVGRELLQQVISYKPAEIIGLDNNESALFFLSEEYISYPEVHLFLGDVRDRDKLVRKTEGVDVILHTAALKHVILCEKSPTNAIQTNILGLQNVIDAAIANSVKRVLFTSSDKAVNPTNVMGTSKLMGERLLTAANAHRRGDGPIFASTRFGNVLGSRGSVIPLFKQQISRGGPLTLTDPRMTRFIMTLEEAVRLVMDSVFLAHGGEVFVTKMAAIRIEDLAKVMIQELAPHHGYQSDQIEIKIIGSKPGEKLYEELLNNEETRRTVELASYFVVLPAFKSVYETITYNYPGMSDKDGVERPYNSSVAAAMTRQELRQYLIKHQLL
jgi:FlaA1/EpsC-like NDP-sugar epimerase